MRGAGMLRWVGVLAIGIAVGALAGDIVAAHVGAALPSASPVRLTTRVANATLERTLRYPATADWTADGQVYAPTGGIVTQVATPSGVFHAGDIALLVDERPMVVIPGPLPAFRALALGSRGRDVRALQDFLVKRGYAVNQDHSVYTAATTAAVKQWQRSLRAPVTGSVALGDVLFMDPTYLDGSPLRWTDVVHVGAPIVPGVPILDRLGGVPSLRLEFGGSLPPQVTPGLRGVAAFPGGGTLDIVVGAVSASQQSTIVELTTATGLLCATADCLRLVPAAGTTDVQVLFTLVPKTTGPSVPASAVQSAADGTSFVERADGTRVPVRVVATSGGTAIVDGVSVGDEVILP